VPGALALAGLVVAAWLLLATGVPDAPTRPATTCADRVVWHGARLSDC
jgi:hypothetical protein